MRLAVVGAGGCVVVARAGLGAGDEGLAFAASDFATGGVDAVRFSGFAGAGFAGAGFAVAWLVAGTTVPVLRGMAFDGVAAGFALATGFDAFFAATAFGFGSGLRDALFFFAAAFGAFFSADFAADFGTTFLAAPAFFATFVATFFATFFATFRAFFAAFFATPLLAAFFFATFVFLRVAIARPLVVGISAFKHAVCHIALIM